MNKIARILRHRWLDESDVHRLLGRGALERIEAKVRASERRHSGEIRVCVEAGLPLGYLWRNLGAHERAVTMFGKLRVWDTEHNNGVLIYLLLAEHRIEVLADRGIHRRAGAERWAQVVAQMREAFRAGQFEAGLAAAIDTIDALLVEHFPLAPGEVNPNELPDAPVIS
ncbi:TPM domain-containing protein [Caldimonas sp. KR1-144]|uniref:TPM domain-containing protein n=1 Tax=Caldimonas sp. KR1-144 TaxID=3400911 RepID=UPI003BFCFA36